MATRLIIDGNAVYEIDEDCLECQKKKAAFREGNLLGGGGSEKQKEAGELRKKK